MRLQGLESKTKGAYTREELGPLAQTNVESLKEYAYFTFARADGKKERFSERSTIISTTGYGADPALHAAAEDPAQAEAIDAGSVRPLLLHRFPDGQGQSSQAGRRARWLPDEAGAPSDGTATAQKLNEQTFMDGPNANFGMMFANKITVDCP